MSGLRPLLMTLACVLAGVAPATSGALGFNAASGLGASTGETAAPSNAPASMGGPLSGVVVPEQYRVGPGDQFALWIWGPISRSLVLGVGPEGDVLIPDFGAVSVTGLTLKEAREKLRERVRRSLRGVEVDVELSHLRTFRVYLTGHVTHPGPLGAMGTYRVADVLVDSMFALGASHRNIQVRRPDGSGFVVDLQHFLLTGGGGADSWLAEGDIIHVPLATRFVGIWGAVGRPGSFELGPHDSLSTLLRLAGGLLPSAQWDGARLVRWRTRGERESLSVSLGAEGVLSGDVELEDGDQFYVLAHPGFHESQQVRIEGRVPREGVFPIRMGVTRLTDAITAAGGFLEDADRSAIHLVRAVTTAQADPEFERLLRLSRGEMTASEYEAFRSRLASHSPDIRVDWRQLEAGRRELDLLLQDGDVIRIERRTSAVRVEGQVRRPGLIPYAAGESYEYYLRMAGGFARRGARSQVRITRAANGQSMLARDAGRIAPGDQLWVPERPDIAPWQYLKESLVVAAQLATVYLAVRK